MTKRAVTPPSPWVVRVMIAPVKTKSSKLFLPPSRFFLKTSTSVFKLLQSKNLFFTLMVRSGFSGTRKMTQSAEATWHAKISHVGAMKPNVWIHRPLVNWLKTPPMKTSICMIAVGKIGWLKSFRQAVLVICKRWCENVYLNTQGGCDQRNVIMSSYANEPLGRQEAEQGLTTYLSSCHFSWCLSLPHPPTPFSGPVVMKQSLLRSFITSMRRFVHCLPLHPPLVLGTSFLCPTCQ